MPRPRPPAGRAGGRAGALLRRARSAGGAIAAQVSQALASLLLQVLVSRTLGEVGLSTYALLYGGVVLATAVITGLVGDTLTVVDRADPRTRSGLQWWSVGVALLLGALAAVLGATAVDLGSTAALVLGAAVAAFLVEDVLRRLLMACSRFWWVVLVDGAALLGALATVLVARAVVEDLTLGTFLLALLVGQVVASVVAVVALPRAERHLAPWRRPDLRVVIGFGTWRAAQQTLRPGMLTAARVVVIAALGAATYGRLEAARLLVTPVTLVVAGVGNLLLVRYAGARAGTPVRTALRRADAAAGGLLVLAVVLGGAAALTTPLLEDVITGGGYRIDEVAVLGWVIYAATSGVLLPYTTLAAVHRRQRSVFALRLTDTVLTVGLVALLVLVLDAGASVVPYALSTGSLLSAVLVRRAVLVPLSREDSARTAGSAGRSTSS